MAEPVPGISAVPDETNARYFHVVVAGKQSDVLFFDFQDLIICTYPEQSFSRDCGVTIRRINILVLITQLSGIFINEQLSLQLHNSVSVCTTCDKNIRMFR